jgi:hypothetical protein
MTLGRDTLSRLVFIMKLHKFLFVVLTNAAIFILFCNLIVIIPNAIVLSGITPNVILMNAILVNGVAPILNIN